MSAATLAASYEPRPIERARRTKLAVEQLNEQILDLCREHHPLSVRNIFYVMTNPRLPESVEKTERGCKQVQARTVLLRRAGRLEYGWITDATRRGYHTPTYSGAADFMRALMALYRADLWQYSEYYCEVWCESRSIAGVIQALCEELAVSLYPAGGFSSISLAYNCALDIVANSRGRPIIIYYIGDYDASGVLIDVAIERELRLHLPAHVQLEFIRLAITPEQIAEYNLPPKPQVGSDGMVLRTDAGKTKYVPVLEWADRDARDRFSASVIAAVREQYGIESLEPSA